METRGAMAPEASGTARALASMSDSLAVCRRVQESLAEAAGQMAVKIKALSIRVERLENAMEELPVGGGPGDLAD